VPKKLVLIVVDGMMPEAFEHGGKFVGVMTALGFATAYTIHVLA